MAWLTRLRWLPTLAALSCASAPARPGAAERSPIELLEIIQALPADLQLVRIETTFLEQARPPGCAEGRPFRVDLVYKHSGSDRELPVRTPVGCAWSTGRAFRPAVLFVHQAPDGTPAARLAAYDPLDPPIITPRKQDTVQASELPATMTPARLVERVPPAIPRGLRHSGDLPAYTANLCVRRDGTVGTVRLHSERHHPELDARVLDALRRWRFEPFRLRGTAIARCTPVRLKL